MRRTSVKLKVAYLLGLLLLLVISNQRVQAKGLSFSDYTITRRMDYALSSQLYERIFPNAAKWNDKFYQPYDHYKYQFNTSSTSFPTAFRKMKEQKTTGSKILKIVWKATARKLKKDLKKQLKDLKNQSALPGVATFAYPKPLFTRSTPRFKVKPRLKISSKYVKPELKFLNIFSLPIEMGASYHSRNEILESKLIGKITKHLEFKAVKKNRFGKNNEPDNYEVGLQYSF